MKERWTILDKGRGGTVTTTRKVPVVTGDTVVYNTGKKRRVKGVENRRRRYTIGEAGRSLTNREQKVKWSDGRNDDRDVSGSRGTRR